MCRIIPGFLRSKLNLLLLLSLLIGVLCVLGPRTFPILPWPQALFNLTQKRGFFKNAVVVYHQANEVAIVTGASSPNYQKVVSKAESIVSSSILISRAKQRRLTLAVDPATFPEEMQESNYIEIRPEQPFKVEGQSTEYDNLRFVLSGEYEGVIFLRAANTSHWGAWRPANKKLFWSLGEFLGLPPHLQTDSPALRQTASEVPNDDHVETLRELGIKITGFYKEYTARLDGLHPTQLGYYTDVCAKGGYDLSAYRDQNLTFTGYQVDVTYEGEFLNAWVVSAESETACVYLAVRKGSTLVPGLFSIANPLLEFSSR